MSDKGSALILGRILLHALPGFNVAWIRIHLFILSPCCLLLLSSPIEGATITYGWFALHRKDKFSPTKTTPFLCDNLSTSEVEPNYSPNFSRTPCYQYITHAPAPGSSQVYLVVGNLSGGDGVAGASFGIDYAGSEGIGVDPRYVTWTACNDGGSQNVPGPHGDWPAPKSGIRVTWNTCQTTFISPSGIHAIVGSFYVYAYSDDVLRLTPNNNIQPSPELLLSNCDGIATDFMSYSYWPSLLGKIGFGSSLAWLPLCWWDPVHPSTWGKVKSQYSSPENETQKQ